MQTAAENEKKAPVAVPANMQAAVYRGVNDIRVETVPVPAIGSGEVLIQVHSCGICGTDLKKIHTGSHSAPRIFGHETVGYVRVMDWIVQRGLIKIPDGIPFAQAVFVEPLNTCLKGVRSLNLAADETVLVIGQGPIGIMLASLAKRSGAKVLTSDLYPERHAVAATFGLDLPIDASKEDVVKVVRAASDGRGADAVILAAAGNSLIRTAMDAARPGGRVLLFAQTQHGEAIIDPAAVCVDEKTLLGSYSASVDIQDEALRIVFEGYGPGYNLTRLVSHRFPLSKAVEAIAIASEPKATSMKIVIEGTPARIGRE
jgi:L-iditol 2-dehydrogenase